MKPLRRVLPITEARCRPMPACPMQNACARFMTATAMNAPVSNHRNSVSSSVAGGSYCPYHLPLLLRPGEAQFNVAGEKPVKRHWSDHS